MTKVTSAKAMIGTDDKPLHYLELRPKNYVVFLMIFFHITYNIGYDTAVREICVSLHKGGLIEEPSESPLTS